MSHPAAQVDRKREVLSLCIPEPLGLLRVDVPETEPQFRGANWDSPLLTKNHKYIPVE